MLHPQFIDFGSHRLFSVYRNVDPASDAVGSVIFLPAFAEEMNRTRSFIARTAAELCAQGLAVCQPDLSGTGDSTGDFCDARFENWVDELLMFAEQLRSAGRPVYAVSVRAGSLFLPELIERAPEMFEKICLVEPYFEGSDAVSDFLQIRVARSMFEGAKESISTLQQSLEEGVTVDVAGYELSPFLYKSIHKRSLAELQFNPAAALIVGCGRSEQNKRNQKAQAAVEHWRSLGNSVDYVFTVTDPFWSQELPTTPSSTILEIVKFLKA